MRMTLTLILIPSKEDADVPNGEHGRSLHLSWTEQTNDFIFSFFRLIDVFIDYCSSSSSLSLEKISRHRRHRRQAWSTVFTGRKSFSFACHRRTWSNISLDKISGSLVSLLFHVLRKKSEKEMSFALLVILDWIMKKRKGVIGRVR